MLPNSYIDEFGAQFSSTNQYNPHTIKGGNASSKSNRNGTSYTSSKKGSNRDSKTSSSSKSRGSPSNWVYSEGKVCYGDINNLLNAEEASIPEAMFSDAVRRLAMDFQKVESQNDKNTQLLREQKQMLKELKNQKGLLSQEIQEYVEINDNDRDEIIRNTKKLEEARLGAEEISKRKKRLKPGEKLNWKSKKKFNNNQKAKNLKLTEGNDEDEDDEHGEADTAELLNTRRQSTSILKELNGLQESLDSIVLLDITDTDFLNELNEISESQDPASKRFGALVNSLTEQIAIETEVLEELEQQNLRERHHQLSELTKERGELDILKKELKELESRAFMSQQEHLDYLSSEKKAKEGNPLGSLLSSIPINTTPYNFQSAPDQNDSVSHHNSYQENLANFRRSSRNSSKGGFYMEPKYSQSNSSRKYGSAVSKGNAQSFRKKNKPVGVGIAKSNRVTKTERIAELMNP